MATILSKDNIFSQENHASSNQKSLFDLEQECLVCMAEHSFPIDKIVINDSWQRLSIDGGGDQDEWYIAHSGISTKGNPWLICSFGTWVGGFQKSGTYKSWDSNQPILPEETERLKKEFSEWERQNNQRKTEEEKGRTQKARNTWDKASDEPIDQMGPLIYLSRKKIGRHGVRFGERIFKEGSGEKPQFNRYPTIIIPLRDLNGEVQAVQHIREDGTKRFDGPSRGGFHILGTIDPNSRIYVAEGYATAASIFEAQRSPTVVAFDCGNLGPVVEILREKYPKNLIIIAGDDDVETKGNPGRDRAEAVAREYECKVVFPVFLENWRLPPDKNGEGKSPTDWNDLHVHFGIDVVRKQLEALEKPKPRLITLTHKELIEKAIPPRKYVLHPWLPEAAISMVFAAPGIGKSYLCLSAAGAIASGGTLFKTTPWTAPEPQRVLYIDGEMHEADLQTRVKKLLHQMGKNIPEDHLRYLNGSWQEEFIPDLSIAEGQRLVEEVIADQGTKVLFLDNLSTLCRAGRENETDSWKQMQAWLLHLRWRGIAVVLIHHAGKSRDENGKLRQRGTSMREVVLESTLALDRPKDYSEEMGLLFELSYTKARGFFVDEATPIEVRLVEKDDVFSWEDKKLSVKTYDTVVDIYNEGTISATAIAKEIGISPQAVRKHLRRAKKNGDIK